MDFDVELVGVTKTFGEVRAVDNISLGAKPREFMTLLGPSGCGKSTALRCIAGLEKLDKGDIFIKGQRINDVPPYKRSIGLVFQNYSLFPHMNVFDNVAFGLKIRKLNEKEIKEKIRKCLELIRLPGYENRYPSQLSGGEQQRVAVARALVIEPAVLLLDEPLSNLDLKLRIQMRVEIVRLQKELGIATIYVTHDQGEAMSMSDRVAIMEHGKIRQVGTPTGIYNSPQDEFIADFIGEANIFRGKILERNEKGVKILIDNNLTLFASAPEKEKKLNRDVQVFVRPEVIKLSKKRPRLRNVFKGTIETIEYLGSYSKYHISLNDNQKIIAHTRNRDVLGFSRGKKTYIGWDAKDCAVIYR